MKKFLKIFVISAFFLIVCSFFQFQNIQSAILGDPKIEIPNNESLAAASVATMDLGVVDMLADQAEAAEAAEAESQLDTIVDDVLIVDQAFTENELVENLDGSEAEKKDEEKKDEEEEEIEGQDLNLLQIPVAEESASTFERDFLALLDGENGELYQMLFSTTALNYFESGNIINESIAAFKNKISLLYDPFATSRNTSNQNLINEIEKLELKYDVTLERVMNQSFAVLLSQLFAVGEGRFEDVVRGCYHMFMERITDQSIKQNPLTISPKMLDNLVKEPSSVVTPVDLYQIVLYGTIAAGGMIILNV